MDLFARVNQVYGSFFGTSPPARACVGVDLPEGIHVRLECTAYAEQSPLDRQALHVQGLSYWAPANIGPYSQAIIVSHFHYVYSCSERVVLEDRGAYLHFRTDWPDPQPAGPTFTPLSC
jgi:hypothetical protein